MSNSASASTAAAVSLLLLAGCASSPSEQTRTVAVEPGTATKVGSASQWNSSCQMLRIPTLTIVEPPKNGLTEVKQAMNAISGSTIGSNPCAGREVEGAGLFYTSAPGFHGTDRLRYTAYLPGSAGLPGNTLAYTVNITVR